eukprot:TRINITY_DN916_c0_g1_i4.p1 TRINITY_DN916_c0_g1~~TRINITY_DN916_c0_g1_i4.p1  ORF type:complete len:351 (-),score=39.70 TRINITY_DN916_c0_g1_i4:439-1491(-)
MFLNIISTLILFNTLHIATSDEKNQNEQKQQKTEIQAKEEQLQCDNNPNYRRLDIPIHEDTILGLTNETYRSQVLFIPRISEKRPYIYHINGKKPNQEFIICTTPKSGNTRVKMMLQKIQDQSSRRTIYRFRQYHPLAWKTPQEINKLLQNSSIPRFIIARDPYIRVISMYNDKIAQKADVPEKLHNRFFQGLHVNPKQKKNMTFDEFVELLYHRNFGNNVHLEHPVDRHFQAQSTLCALDLGLSYNYVLKLENMNDWYDCFVRDVNVREEVMHGYPEQDDCFFSSPMFPCKGPVLRENGVMASVQDAMSQQHQTGSAAMVHEFYTNETTLKMVTQIYWEDIINFNYQFL